MIRTKRGDALTRRYLPRTVNNGFVRLVKGVADDHDFFAGAVAAVVHDNALSETRINATPDVVVAK